MPTIVIPYFSQPKMLKRQLEEIAKYPAGYMAIVVDDCSIIPASDVIQKADNVSLYRITTEIPWNRGGARNLASMEADTEWIIHVDIDHVLPVECAERLLQFKPNPVNWYRFPRYRVGRADETRKKDQIPDDCEYGKIHPHIDSYLITKKAYWQAGGYNEDYSGCLGGGSPFLEQLQIAHGRARTLSDDIYLWVFTRDRIPDASVSGLSRDKSEYKARRFAIGNRKADNPLRFEWVKVW